MARARIRAKIPVLCEALTGRFGEHYALLCRTMIDRIDAVTASVNTLTVRIEQEIAPLQAEVERLSTIPGVGTRHAQVILAEIGTDMTRFPTAGHFASWAGV